METIDIVVKMIKKDDVYLVSFGTMSQIYTIKSKDKNLDCLQESIQKKVFVKIDVDLDKMKILSCNNK
jgi:hypothetical protein